MSKNFTATAATFWKAKRCPEHWEEISTKRFKFVLASHKELDSMPPRHHLFVFKNGNSVPFCSYNYEVSIMTGDSFLCISNGNIRQNLGEAEAEMSLDKFQDLAFKWASNELNLTYDEKGKYLKESESNQDASEVQASLAIIVIGVLLVLFLLNTGGPWWLITVAVGVVFCNLFVLLSKWPSKNSAKELGERDSDNTGLRGEAEIDKKDMVKAGFIFDCRYNGISKGQRDQAMANGISAFFNKYGDKDLIGQIDIQQFDDSLDVIISFGYRCRNDQLMEIKSFFVRELRMNGFIVGD